MRKYNKTLKRSQFLNLQILGISPLTYYLVEIFQYSDKTFDPFWSAIIVSVTEIVGKLEFYLTQ